MEDDLVASGRFVRIETRGAQSGAARAVTVGFVEDDPTDPAGAILVAAGSPETAWARNLLADPRLPGPHRRPDVRRRRGAARRARTTPAPSAS